MEVVVIVKWAVLDLNNAMDQNVVETILFRQHIFEIQTFSWQVFQTCEQMQIEKNGIYMTYLSLPMFCFFSSVNSKHHLKDTQEILPVLLRIFWLGGTISLVT